MNKNYKASILLLLLSPAIPELLTGSTPFIDFLNPFNMIILITIYGIPSLLIREYSIYYGLNYVDIVLAGLALGILVEGLAVNTYYDPRVSKIGVLAEYGRLLGINWCWIVYITIFHSIFSVLVPIMLVESFYPEAISVNTIARRRLKYLLIPVFIVTVIFNISSETYRPAMIYYLFSIVSFFLVILLYRVNRVYRVIERIHIPMYPYKLLILYPIVFIIILLYGMTYYVHPIIHVLLGIIYYILLLKTLSNIKRDMEYRKSIWRFSSQLVIGLAITGVLIGLFNNLYYIFVPAIFFISLMILVDKAFV